MEPTKDKVVFTVDDVEYQLLLLSTTRAFLTGQELAKLTLPSAGAAFDGTVNSDMFEETQTFAAAAMLLVNQLGTVDILSIIKELLGGLTVGDQPIEFDSYFKGRLNILLEILETALKENYGSLFIGTGLMQKLQKSMKVFQTPSADQNYETQPEQD